MARLWGQLMTLVFAVVGLGGLALGNATSRPGGAEAGGNLGALTLHLTPARHALDIVVLLVALWIGFLARRTPGRLATALIAVVLVAVAVLGFVVGDDTGATKGALGLHFPIADNLFDLVTGLLGVLAAAGTLSDDEVAAPRGARIRG